MGASGPCPRLPTPQQARASGAPPPPLRPRRGRFDASARSRDSGCAPGPLCAPASRKRSQKIRWPEPRGARLLSCSSRPASLRERRRTSARAAWEAPGGSSTGGADFGTGLGGAAGSPCHHTRPGAGDADGEDIRPEGGRRQRVAERRQEADDGHGMAPADPGRCPSGRVVQRSSQHRGRAAPTTGGACWGSQCCGNAARATSSCCSWEMPRKRACSATLFRHYTLACHDANRWLTPSNSEVDLSIQLLHRAFRHYGTPAPYHT